ncbi:MAG: RdgB/HAM1 family non-canonical purine NTP pyrophosphatase [Pyrinomonadaceae bacterium]|nr:RdgB/HAM1 family non-canonical purine NTP pyrophosphatase [Pyrinomonadaceae bacterium]
MKKLLIATTNPGKIGELRRLLGHLHFEIISLSDIDPIPEPKEDGLTFEENAEKKAVGYSVASGLHAVADDSGLEVFSLDCRPGVFSARFAGLKANDSANNAKLLGLLEGMKGKERKARFRCAIAIADPHGNVLTTVSAECCGRIETKPFGSNGFGYDPIFVPDGFDETFGMLSDKTKSGLSHRALAAKKLVDFLENNSGLVT